MVKNRIAIIEAQFLVNYYKPEGGITVGGTQRYVHQLGTVLKQMGFSVVFLTKSCKEVTFDFDNIGTVKTLSAPLGSRGNRIFSQKVYNYAKQVKANFVCYSDLQLAFWKCYEKNFALQHGIDWDGPYKKFVTKINNFIYLKAANKITKIICVDTNYINWVRLHDKHYFDMPEKYVYIPNFAECTDFSYQYVEWKKGEPVTLLYPRRMVKHRGFDMFINMCEKLYILGYHIKPILAIEEESRERALNIVKDCKCEYDIIHPKMNEMSKIYRQAFLTYVPTMWSEGTSLSAIESICSGCPALVTDVGGLGNIVIPDYNGDILPYSVDLFVCKTAKLIEHPEIRNRWSQNCKNLRDAFDVKRWNEKVENIINNVSK